ncbi:RNA-binding domain-containing protein, partial [Rhodotorula sp. JG-1b]
THLLPPNLLKLFAPRSPLPYLKPPGRDPDFPLKSLSSKRAPKPILVSEVLEEVRAQQATEEADRDGAVKEDGGAAPVKPEEDKKPDVKAEPTSQQATADDAPQDDEEICGDPYKTLFVGRIPREVTEKDLLREFELYGPIDRLRLVVDPETGLSRGYAFIVYERERDMKAAYKDADGLKMKGKRLLIDVERGRTVKGWKPRRLGGGLGG